MAIVNGKSLLLYRNSTSTVIAHTRTCSLSISQGTEDITTKDDGDWEKHIATLKNATVSFEGLVASGTTGTVNTDGLIALIVGASASNTDTWYFQAGASPGVGDVELSFTGTLESLEVGADNQSPATLSGTIKLNGAITQTVTTS